MVLLKRYCSSLKGKHGDVTTSALVMPTQKMSTSQNLNSLLNILREEWWKQCSLLPGGKSLRASAHSPSPHRWSTQGHCRCLNQMKWVTAKEKRERENKWTTERKRETESQRENTLAHVWFIPSSGWREHHLYSFAFIFIPNSSCLHMPVSTILILFWPCDVPQPAIIKIGLVWQRQAMMQRVQREEFQPTSFI